MDAEMLQDKLLQVRLALAAMRSRFTDAHAGASAGNGLRDGLSALADQARHSGLDRQILAVVLISSGILLATYLAAATLVEGAAAHSTTRAQHSMVLQQAAVNYRLARAQCERIGAAGRDACIAQAHAEESRSRAVAALAPQSELAALRSRTNAAIEAGDHDSIVIEPACNVVMRGQLSLCEIQVRSGGTERRAASAASPQAVELRASKAPMNRAAAQSASARERGANAGLLYVLADSPTRRHEMTYLKAVAASP